MLASPSSTSLPSHTTGHCHCGKTRYRLRLTDIESDLALSGYCHCSKCQRLNGAPFVWTTHWEGGAVEWLEPEPDRTDFDSPNGWMMRRAADVLTEGDALVIPLKPDQPVVPTAKFASTMTIFESMEGRKWKQRCSTCGTPMGSWNEAKRRWSIWPSSLARSYQPEGDGASSPERAIHPSILAAIRADHHQFYGPWRLMNIDDDLPKWDGYKEQSQRVS